MLPKYRAKKNLLEFLRKSLSWIILIKLCCLNTCGMALVLTWVKFEDGFTMIDPERLSFEKNLIFSQHKQDKCFM